MHPFNVSIIPNLFGVVLFLFSCICISFGQPILSDDPIPACQVKAHARNGNTHYEGILFTPGTPPPGDPDAHLYQMDPEGQPAWDWGNNEYGDSFKFYFAYRKLTGRSAWYIDFNRDNDFEDAEEFVSRKDVSLTGQGFKYVLIELQAVQGTTAHIDSLRVNAVDFGSWTSTGDSVLQLLFEDETGLFENVSVYGSLSFSGDAGIQLPRIGILLGLPNAPPVCTIGQPIMGAEFDHGETILIEAQATDPDGSVVFVSYYDNTTLIGTDSVSPFIFSWNGAQIGDHVLTAVATDNLEATQTSNAVVIQVNPGEGSQSPECVIITPQQGQVFTLGQPVQVNASATDDGNILFVRFYDGTLLIGEDQTEPYELVWSGAFSGPHVLTVSAVDNEGLESQSAPVEILINNPPFCLQSSPDGGGVFTFGETIPLVAIASDMDGMVSRVDFYAGDVKIGEDATEPFSMHWLASISGNLIMTAIAIDNHGSQTTSAPVQIVVNAPPTCSITYPTDGLVLYDPPVIQIQAAAFDENDQVSLVEFYVDNDEIGEDSNSPFENQSMINPAMGNYVLTARATDMFGLNTLSIPSTITVRCVREDLDFNGVVNTFDFLIFLAEFGVVCEETCQPDFDDDGAVNTIDYLHLLTQIGYTCN